MKNTFLCRQQAVLANNVDDAFFVAMSNFFCTYVSY